MRLSERRSRDVPAGTVGGRIAPTRKPRSRRRSATRIVAVSSPTGTGTTGESPSGTPGATSRRRVRHRRESAGIAARSSAENPRTRRTAASAAPAAAGGRYVEKMNSAPKLTRKRRSVSSLKSVYAPPAPSAFPSVPTSTSACRASPRASVNPPPFLPNQPVACASSTIQTKPNSSRRRAIAARSG